MSKYKVGDLVWAKMKGFSPWPAQVVEPNEKLKRPTLKKPMHCVFFFGTKNYAWVLEDLVMPYQECKEKYLKNNKAGSFKEAIEAIEEYIRTHPEDEDTTKQADLPTIDEEIAKICPNGSGKTSLKEPSKLDTKTKSRTLGKTLSKSPKQRAIKTLTSSKKEHLSKIKKRKTSDSASSLTSNKLPHIETNSLDYSNSLPSIVSHETSYLNSSSLSKSGLLSRPAYVTRPSTPPMDVEHISDTLKKKKVVPSGLKFGFLGLGIMGRGIVKNLLHSGHHITVWNRTPSKCNDFLKAGAVKGQTPADVVAASDITFSCVSDPQVAKEMVFGNCGVMQEIRPSKGYVEMTSVDPETSMDISDAIIARGGRYIEAQLFGSKGAAEDGSLIILGAGDRSLFNDCGTCFQAMGKHAFYLGDIGNASKMNLILNTILGTTLAGMAEAMGLAERAGVAQKDLLEILELGSLNCPAVIEKGKAMIEGSFVTNMPLRHMQKDLSLALVLGEQVGQPLPLTAAANEMYKHAKQLSYGEHDVSAIYLGVRF